MKIFYKYITKGNRVRKRHVFFTNGFRVYVSFLRQYEYIIPGKLFCKSNVINQTDIKSINVFNKTYKSDKLYTILKNVIPI